MACQTIRSVNAPIAYWTDGNGPPVLLIHGTTCDRHIWEPVKAVLSESYKVVTVNRRGRDGSAPMDEGPLQREFNDVAEVISTIGEDVHVVGHSAGALVALGAALQTNRLRSLVLYEPPMPNKGMVRAAESLRRIDESDRSMAFLAGIGESSRNLARLADSLFWARIAALGSTIPTELESIAGYTLNPSAFATLALPTLGLVGENTPPHFRLVVDSLQPVIAGMQLAELAGQQHLGNMLDPQLFSNAILSFLGEVDA